MGGRDDIALRVRDARGDARRADELVRDYLPFIKAETARFLARPSIEGADDELGIAMFAFHEAVLAYDRSRGAFLPLAARVIRNRLVDFRRREARHAQVESLDRPAYGDEPDDARTLLDGLDSGRDEIGERHARAASRQEIAEFARVLEGFGITLADVADNCPRQERTVAACLEKTGRLPMAALAEGAGVERKTLERHRRYLVALLLAYTNGYEVIRGHLYRFEAQDGGSAR